jgi:hypothetical protein
MSPDDEPQVDGHRMDTGEAIKDKWERPSLWKGRLPETLGYLVEVQGIAKDSFYSVEIEVPRVLISDGPPSRRR